MKALLDDKRKAYVQVISALVDPFYSREIFFLLLVLMTTSAYVSTVSNNGFIVDPIDVISVMAFYIFIVLLIYPGVVAGNFGSFVGRGAEAFFFTTPVNRLKLYLVVWLFTILFSFLLFSLYLIFLIYLLTFTLFSFPITILLIETLSSLSLYTSVGMLIAVITRNSAASIVSVLALFLGLSLYSTKIFPNSLPDQSFVSGIRFMGEYPLKIGVTFWPSIILIMLSVIIFISTYVILKSRDHRSGRNA